MPHFRGLFRSSQAVTVEAASGDDSATVFQVLDRSGASLFSVGSTYAVAPTVLVVSTVAGVSGLPSVDINLPTTGYSHVRIIFRATTNDTSFSQDTVILRCNGDTNASNYQTEEWYGRNAATTNAINTSNNIRAGYIPSSAVGNDANATGAGQIFIPFYNTSDSYKTVLIESGEWMAVADMGSGKPAGTYKQTTAVSQVNLLPNNGTIFKQGSRFMAYIF